MQGYNVFFSEPVLTGMVPEGVRKGGRIEIIVAMEGRRWGMGAQKSSQNFRFAGRVTTVRASTYKFMFLEINLYFDLEYQ